MKIHLHPDKSRRNGQEYPKPVAVLSVPCHYNGIMRRRSVHYATTDWEKVTCLRCRKIYGM